MEGFHGEAGGHGQPHFWVPTSVKRAGGAHKAGAGEVFEESLPGPAGGLGPITSLG